MSISVDDFATWLAAAYDHAELAAHQIARFRNPTWNPTWQDLLPRNPLHSGWGSHRRRTRRPARPIRVATRPVKKEVEEKEVAVFSPETPLDFGSGSGSGSGCGPGSTCCGGDEESSLQAVKKRRDLDGADVSGCCVNNNQLPWKISSAKDKKLVGAKRRLCELQEEEKSLLEEKNKLQQILGMRRNAYEDLKAENQRLKKQQLNMQPEGIFVKPAATSAAPSSSCHFILPDLNEPWSDDMN